MDTMMPHEPRATRRLTREQARQLAEAVGEEARAVDPISNEALYQRLVAPRKLASVAEVRRSNVEVRRSKPTSVLVSAANHTFRIIVLAILVVTASPVE
jgi:hypothetical protein